MYDKILTIIDKITSYVDIDDYVEVHITEKSN